MIAPRLPVGTYQLQIGVPYQDRYMFFLIVQVLKRAARRCGALLLLGAIPQCAHSATSVTKHQEATASPSSSLPSVHTHSQEESRPPAHPSIRENNKNCRAIKSATVDFSIPELRSRVNDYAELLTPEEEQQLAQPLRLVADSVGSQIAILTIESLPETSIENYSLAVANTWKLGRAEFDDGILIVLSEADHVVRIALGLGLEVAIPDDFAAETIDLMTPDFRAGRFYDGLLVGCQKIIDRIHEKSALIGRRNPNRCDALQP